MPIRVTCDECRRAFDAPDEDADGLAPCPACGAACLVPVPGALPPLRAEAIEPDAEPEPPAREALALVRRRAWAAFARACGMLRAAVALDFACYVLAAGVYVYYSASGPKPALWPLVLLFGPLAGAALYGALARVLLFGTSGRSGAGALFAVGAALAWGRALLLAAVAVRAFAAFANGAGGADTFHALGAMHGCSTLLALLVEVSAVPGMVAAGAVLPSAEVRAWALRLAVAIQLTFAALVGVVIADALVGLSGLFPLAGGGASGSPAPVTLSFTFAARAVYTFLQYNLYDAGERAGRGGGD